MLVAACTQVAAQWQSVAGSNVLYANQVRRRGRVSIVLDFTRSSKLLKTKCENLFGFSGKNLPNWGTWWIRNLDDLVDG